jgi:lipopolysaccharide export system protein LptA
MVHALLRATAFAGVVLTSVAAAPPGAPSAAPSPSPSAAAQRGENNAAAQRGENNAAAQRGENNAAAQRGGNNAAAQRGAPNVAPTPGAPSASTKDFRIETDQTNSNLNNGQFAMPHRVRFFRPGTDSVGDSAQGNFKSGVVTIIGHVVLHDNGESSEAQKAGATTGGGPATLECDQLEVDSKRKVYTATGNVRYVQGQRHATADIGTLDRPAHALDLVGNVHLADGDETLTAQSVHYDTLTKDISTSGSPVILNQPAGHGVPSSGSTLPTPAAKATPKPK